jgi:hypothetical protein
MKKITTLFIVPAFAALGINVFGQSHPNYHQTKITGSQNQPK